MESCALFCLLIFVTFEFRRNWATLSTVVLITKKKSRPKKLELGDFSENLIELYEQRKRKVRTNPKKSVFASSEVVNLGQNLALQKSLLLCRNSQKVSSTYLRYVRKFSNLTPSCLVRTTAKKAAYLNLKNPNGKPFAFWCEHCVPRHHSTWNISFF